MAEKTGERRDQILQTLAQMLENPAGEKVTTAALAARIKVSEAALYRHFKGKAEMFEGLIEFIEQTLFALINRITGEEKSGLRQIEGILSVLLGFAQKNRGMTRVLIGDALVNEDERLQLRINQLHDRLEAAIKQALRFGVSQKEFAEEVDVAAADIFIVMPCGFSLGRTISELTVLCRNDPACSHLLVSAAKTYVVDAGAYFSRPGPRLVDGVELLADICAGRVRTGRQGDSLRDVTGSLCLTGLSQ